MHVTWLDSNTWLIELGGQRILLDPWLVGRLVFSNLSWLIEGKRLTSRSLPENLDLILLSQGLEDHAHPPTLQQLDKTIPVVASPSAAKVAQQLNYRQAITLDHFESIVLRDRLKIQAFPGFPVGPFVVENAYLLEDLERGVRLYYEPHGHPAPALQEMGPVDVVITPILNQELPLVGSIIRGGEIALQVCQWLQPQIILPTAGQGDEIEFEGVLAPWLKTRGTLDEFRSLLSARQLDTRVIAPQVGERIALKLEKRTASL
ncbi:MAG: MBL fold metallo-hydrolase [Cyanobacteriota bacterium]|nr:MBL fold metallo-hydrolase [Cyanobacteriota bacterium]